MSKVKFFRLSPDQQKQFGYRADKAKEFEAQVAKATDDWRQESLYWDQIARIERAARQVREAEMEKVMNDRIIAQAQLKQAHPASQTLLVVIIAMATVTVTVGPHGVAILYLITLKWAFNPRSKRRVFSRLGIPFFRASTQLINSPPF